MTRDEQWKKLTESRRVLVLDDLTPGLMHDLLTLAKNTFRDAEVFTRRDVLAVGIPESELNGIGKDWIEVHPPCTDWQSMKFREKAERALRRAYQSGQRLQQTDLTYAGTQTPVMGHALNLDALATYEAEGRDWVGRAIIAEVPIDHAANVASNLRSAFPDHEFFETVDLGIVHAGGLEPLDAPEFAQITVTPDLNYDECCRAAEMTLGLLGASGVNTAEEADFPRLFALMDALA